MDEQAKQALALLSQLQQHARQAQTQLEQAGRLARFQSGDVLPAQKCLEVYNDYLVYLEDLIRQPDEAVPPDIFLV